MLEIKNKLNSVFISFMNKNNLFKKRKRENMLI